MQMLRVIFAEQLAMEYSNYVSTNPILLELNTKSKGNTIVKIRGMGLQKMSFSHSLWNIYDCLFLFEVCSYQAETIVKYKHSKDLLLF